MGGIDWSGLPFVAAYLEIDDVEALVDALLVIKTHRPDREQEPDAQDD